MKSTVIYGDQSYNAPSFMQFPILIFRATKLSGLSLSRTTPVKMIHCNVLQEELEYTFAHAIYYAYIKSHEAIRSITVTRDPC